MHWFRKGLRLHDNPALQEALNCADTVRCVYILDPWFAGSANVGVNRWRFVAHMFNYRYTCCADMKRNNVARNCAAVVVFWPFARAITLRITADDLSCNTDAARVKISFI